MIVGEQDGNLNHYEQNAANSTSFVLRTATFSNINVGVGSVPTFTDLDGDGLLDMLIGEQFGTLRHYEQSSANSTSFTLISDSFNSIDIGLNSKPTFTDLDGDGLLDMIVDEQLGTLNHYEQSAANSYSFTLITETFNSIDVGNFSATTFTDIDGDGLLDMLIGEQDGNLNHYEQNSANSTSFTLINANFNGIDIGSFSSSTFTDIDGDGLLDLFIGKQDGNVAHYEQNRLPVISNLSATTVCEGSNVAITGTSFTGATLVTLNGTSVGTLSGVTATNINFTVPANATSGNVVVTTPSGTSNSVAISIATLPNTPTISGNSTFCAGGSTVLTSSTGNAYLWSNSATTQSITVSSAGTYSVRIISGACTSSSSNAIAVTVTPLPSTPTISGNSSFNEGSSTTLTSSASSGNIWSTGETSQSISVNTPGSYSVRTISGGCTSLTSSLKTITGNTSSYFVSTLAGSGSNTFLNGTGTGAAFSIPHGTAVDVNGNVYVADANNNRIRKITPSGVVTTFAGSGNSAFADGTGTSASFNYPTGLAFDGSGNLYVADAGNNRIRKITSSGVVTTIAGSGVAGSSNGTGTAATFNFPQALTVNGSGNIYVADVLNHRIRQITSSGVVTTFAGSGSAGFNNSNGISASFNHPTGIAIDVNGNLYIAEAGNDAIRKITPAGMVSTFAGSGTQGSTNGTGTSASFYNPNQLTVDAIGNVFVADAENNKIRKITSDGVVSTIAGIGSSGFANGNGTSAMFNIPKGITVDALGYLYVAESSNHRIRKLSPCYVNLATPTISGINALCNGNPTVLTSSPGSGYLWTTGATTQSISVSVPGSYSVQIVSGGCTSAFAESVIVSTASTPSVPTISGNRAICNGTPTTLTSSPGLSYLWSNGATSQSIITDVPGNYHVTVSYPCTSIVSSSVVVSSISSPTFTSFSNPSTSINSNLVINGNNFTGVVSVKFGGIPARFTVTSNTQITLNVPTTANSGPIQITNTAGCVLLTPSLTIGRLSALPTNNYLHALEANSGSSIFGSYGSPTIIDIDGDGLQDVMLGNIEGTCRHYEQNAVGSTFNIVSFAFNNIVLGDFYYAAPVFTDIDGDGLLDLIIGQYFGNLHHYEQVSANSNDFAFITDSFNSIDVGDFSKPTFTDLDGDGLLDLIVGEYDGNLNHYEQVTPNSQNFSLVTSNFSSIDVGVQSSPTFIDIDGDGLLDLIVGEYDGNLNHYEQSSANSLSFSQQNSAFNSIDVGYLSTPTFADLDRNGLLELIVGSQSGFLGRYEQFGTPAISSFSNNPACPGSSISIMGSNLSNASALTINGQNISPITSNTINAITIVLPTDATSGNVIVTTPGGISNSVFLNINTLPSSPTITGSPLLPIGGTTILTSSFVNGNLWSNGDTSQSITINTPGTFSVRKIEGICTSLVSSTVRVDWNVSSYSVSTIAGSGTSGFLNATGRNASFNYPTDIVKDASGNFYVTDAYNHSIRKISSSGVVTTLAGTGSAGFANGTGSLASFNYPYSIAVNSDGDILVADFSNNRIRKVTSSGIVTTFAGQGIAGSGDGYTNGATFNGPTGIAIDNAGNVYVADYNNHRIRKISTDEQVVTFAGTGVIGGNDGTGLSASFSYPYKLAVDANGNIYVSEYFNHRIRKITPAGIVTTLAGSGIEGEADGTGTNATFNGPSEIDVDVNGNLFVADYNNNKIRKITPTGLVTTIAGSGTAGFVDSVGTLAQFNLPEGIAVDPNGTIYVTDANNHSIRKLLPCTNPNTPQVTGNNRFCAGSSSVLTSSVATNNLWSNGATTQSITVTEAGNYFVRSISGACTSAASTQVIVTVSAPTTPTISSTNGTSI
ncbi:MAG: FG-GAP-like repeat-containing protein, partial [Flexibacteraceae bacterium]